MLSVTLEVGELSGVVPEAVEFCFAACSVDTLLERAQLEIIRPLGIGYCQECKEDFPRGSLFDPCPLCGGYKIEQIAGEELRVRALEVEDPEPVADVE